jgi:hypothetical protein
MPSASSTSPPNCLHLAGVGILEPPPAKPCPLLTSAGKPSQHALADHRPFVLGEDGWLFSDQTGPI